MKLIMIGADIAALGAIVGTAINIIPAIVGILGAIYGVMATINYGFVIYDRLKYGPELDNRLTKKKSDDTT